MTRVGPERPKTDAESDPVRGAARPVAFGKYQLFATLGRGGMSDVYLAVARGPMGFNKLVVIKRLRTALAEEPSFLQMFLDEARLAARLNHPNVVHTYEVGEEDGSYFIAMEYLEGQPLNAIVRELAKREAPLEQALAAQIVADALAGLTYAHQLEDYDGTPLKIIHRDLSPHNVFVTYDGQVKLVDFGIAKAILSQSSTEIGVLKGKVAYMAPEQATAAGDIDQRADLFAMGIVLWELLSRRKLFQEPTAAATLHRLLNGSIPKLASASPEVDPVLGAIADRALEKEPSERFATATEMRGALEAWIRSSGRVIRDGEIGERVSALFEDVRGDVKLKVQRAMGAIAAGESPVLDLRMASEPKRRSSGRLGSKDDSSSRTVDGPEPPPPSRAPRDEERRKGSMPLFLVLLVAALVAAIVVMFRVVVARHDPVAGVATGDPSRADVPSTPPLTSAVQAEAPPSPAMSSEPGGSSTSTSAPRASSTSAPRITVPTVATLATTAPEIASGFLTFDTYPWSRVSEGGRLLGTTPLLHLSMSAGVHTLSLENAEQGIRRTYSVTIKPGETFTMRLGIGPQ
jgi:serine/threonine protein kinase